MSIIWIKTTFKTWLISYSKNNSNSNNSKTNRYLYKTSMKPKTCLQMGYISTSYNKTSPNSSSSKCSSSNSSSNNNRFSISSRWALLSSLPSSFNKRNRRSLITCRGWKSMSLIWIQSCRLRPRLQNSSKYQWPWTISYNRFKRR